MIFRIGISESVLHDFPVPGSFKIFNIKVELNYKIILDRNF